MLQLRLLLRIRARRAALNTVTKSLRLSARVRWAMGRLPTILQLWGLPQRPLWLRNHLIHNILRRGCYTYAYAYDIRECMHDL